MAQTIQEFYDGIREDISLFKKDSTYESDTDYFTFEMFEKLKDVGIVDDPVVFSYRSEDAQINGFEFIKDENGSCTLTLFTSIYENTNTLINVSATLVRNAYKRCFNFLKKATSGFYLDQAGNEQPGFGELANDIIFKNKDRLHDTKIIVLINGLTRDMKPEGEKRSFFYGSITYTFWDIERLHKASQSGDAREPIVVDFPALIGKPLSALLGGSSEKTTVYLAVLSGRLLADLYDEYRDRLLERNVRAYLQRKSKVNKGIIETIQYKPDLFLTYNNGLTVTASGVELEPSDSDSDSVKIKSITDFQIVNGGQTTASLSVAKNDPSYESDLNKISVQMKLAVVSSTADMDEMVPEISKNSNSQNNIQASDFASNDRYHQEMETISRKTYTNPMPDGSMRRWYFERARGQYAGALNREPTASKRTKFKAQNVLITKTDLAKVLCSWNMMPNVVSLGSQKCFSKFMDEQKEKNEIPTVPYFKHCIAKTIIFREMETIVLRQRFGGYKANIVAHTYFKLMKITGRRIDLDRIWNEQAISPAMRACIEDLCKKVQSYLVNENKGKNVSEFSKTKECMEGVENIEFDLPEDLEKELLVAELKDDLETEQEQSQNLTKEEREVVLAASQIPAEEWRAIGNWARDNNLFDIFKRSVLFSMANLRKKKKEPTYNQAKDSLDIYNEALNLGFRE